MITNIQQQVSGSWQNALKWMVSHQPTACYQFIQNAFPGQFEKMLSGFELNQTSQKKMASFLEQKANMSNNPVVFVSYMSQFIPLEPSKIK